MRNSSLHRYLPWLLIICPFILMSPVFLTGKAIYWGTPLLQFVPWWTQAWRTLLSGELPLWNPLIGLGAPLLANYQTALLYPPTWIYFLLAALAGVKGIAWGGALMVAAHLAWAGWGMHKLAQRLGWSPLATVVAGLTYGLSGYLVARSHFLSINAAAAWLPWVLLATYELVFSERPRRAALRLALVVGLQLLSGHAQVTWYTLLLATAWLLYWAVQKGGWGGVWRPLARFVGGGAWAGALAAAQLLPTGEYLLQSQRAAEYGYEQAMIFSFWPWRLLTLFSPNLFGSQAQGDYWGYATYWEDAIYIGFLGIILVLAVILRRGKTAEQRSLVRFALVVMAVALLLALGDNTPIFPWLYQHVPTFDMFQAPARYLLWFAFALALLAGLSIDGWRRPEGRGLYWSRLATMGAFAMTVGAGAGWWLLTQTDMSFGELKPTFVPALAITGLFGIGAGILHLTAPPKDDPALKPTWVWLVVGWLALDLMVAGWGLNPGIDLDIYDPVAVPAGRVYISPANVQALTYDRFVTYETFETERGEDWRRLVELGLPNVALLSGGEVNHNFDPLQPGRYTAWLVVMDEFPSVRQEMLYRMAVAYVTGVDPETLQATLYPPDAPGRLARFAPCAVTVDDADAALALVAAGQLDPTTTVVVETLTDLPTAGCTPVAAKYEITKQQANHVTLHVEAETAGVWVLANTWYPGWTARLDGEPVEVMPGDYLFQAVIVPAGAHTLMFAYQPISFYAGLSFSVLGWLAWGLAWRRWDD